MILRHLRHNVVAYLALLVAMTGTSYAAVQIANGSVTTDKLANDAVTSPKINTHAVKHFDLGLSSVTGDNVKAHSLTLDDLAPGTVPSIPPGVGFEATTDTATNPAPTPEATLYTHSINPSRNGTLYVGFASPAVGRNCTNGSARAGLYLDGAPVASTSVSINGDTNTGPLFIATTVPVTAGAHVLSVADECPTGNEQAGDHNLKVTWTLALY